MIPALEYEEYGWGQLLLDCRARIEAPGQLVLRLSLDPAGRRTLRDLVRSAVADTLGWPIAVKVMRSSTDVPITDHDVYRPHDPLPEQWPDLAAQAWGDLRGTEPQAAQLLFGSQATALSERQVFVTVDTTRATALAASRRLRLAATRALGPLGLTRLVVYTDPDPKPLVGWGGV